MKPEAPRISEYLTPYDEWPDEDEFINASFQGLELPHEDLHGRELSGCVLRQVNLSGADLRKTAFVDVVFDHCDLSGVNLSDAVFQRVRFESCRMTGADMVTTVLRNTVMNGGKADFLNLSGAKLDHVLLTDVVMHEAALEECSLRQTSLTGCDLTRATIHRTPMKGMDMRTDCLDGIVIDMSDLRGMIVTAEQAGDLARLLGLVVK